MDHRDICDLAIVGGGLAGGIIAHALAKRRPELTLRLIEPGERLGGNHIWCFFDTDVAADDRWMVDPFVSARWDGYDVRFPAHARTLPIGYNAIRSADFDAALRRTLPAEIVVRAGAARLGTQKVELEDGTRISAKGVIDARGASTIGLLDAGWQKFLGQEYRLAAPHGLTRPVVMDATVAQHDGYRFVYVLPFAPDRLFIEDTYYSDTPDINRALLARRIKEYAAAHGWRPLELLHEEAGALPVTMGGDFDAYWQAGGEGVAKAGTRAALFHPTTGYSLPDAVRTARFLLDHPTLEGAALHDGLRTFARAHWDGGGFYRMLDRMLFRAARDAERYRILQRFYTLAPGLIHRFYAGRSTMLDKARILAGRPPVPIGRAIRALARAA